MRSYVLPSGSRGVAWPTVVVLRYVKDYHEGLVITATTIAVVTEPAFQLTPSTLSTDVFL